MSDIIQALGPQLLGSFNDGKSFASNDTGVMTPDDMMRSKAISDPTNITTDSGSISPDQSNPFLDAIAKSRANGNQGPGVLRQMLNSTFGAAPERDKGGLVPNTGNPRDDELLSPTPNKVQPQSSLQQITPIPNPRPQLPDYSMPQALDPNAIEELRRSLLTDAGQLDPTNPNGLAGRMSGPNSAVDQRNQMNDAQRQTDDLRGFDGARAQRMKAQR